MGDVSAAAAATAALFTPAAQEALQSYAIEPAELRLVTMSENVTFRVVDRADGAPYVLRLHRPGYHTLDELVAERVWIRALAEDGIDVPTPVAARDGSDYVQVTVPSTGQQRYAGVARWTEGELLHNVLQRHDGDRAVFENCFAQLGEITAAMHNQACAWRAPANFARHALDNDGLLGEAPFWGRFWEHPALSGAERQLVLDTRARIRGALARYGTAPATFSLIHADLHPSNVLVNGDRLTVIDFDDAGFGWHQYDIAVALTRQQSHPNFAAVQAAFVSGYRRRRALSDAALALIPMFLLVRGLAVLGWIHQRPELDRAFVNEFKNDVCAQCATFVAPC
jgi:Ser/Thr protein kinase RdoA (MazF antagonist)